MAHGSQQDAGNASSGCREAARWPPAACWSKITPRKRRGVVILLMVGALLCTVSCLIPSSDVPPDVRVASFVCDVTPPLGHPLCGGWIKPAEAVDDPLLAKGIVLAHGRERYVLCAVDWCLLQTGAHDAFRRTLAQAARTTPHQVEVHTVHQHNAPLADADAQRLLAATPSPPSHLDLDFLKHVTDRLADSVRAANRRLEPVTHVGWGIARVEKFASNRRVRLADGQVHVRYSATRDPVLQAAPAGLIDPWLRTVTLFRADVPVVRLHYYASHPMGSYGDGRVSADTVGLARAQVEQAEGVPQIYFTACGGNITAGKYNDGSPEARLVLTSRIRSAMEQSIRATQRMPIDRLRWQSAPIALEPRTETEWSRTRVRSILADPQASVSSRLQAALTAAWLDRLAREPRVNLSVLEIGPVALLHLPGEPFVEYQLYAQSLRPDGLVAVAAYGEGGPGYLCCDPALAEGGYEPTMSRVGPPTEPRLKASIAQLLTGSAPLPRPPAYPDKQHLAVWRDDTGHEQAVRTAAEWAIRRAHILEAMESVMGPAPQCRRGEPPRIAPPNPAAAAIREPAFVRRHLWFETTAGDQVPAWLLLPHTPGRHPAMLCLHQTTARGKDEPAGLSGQTNLHYARELAERGYVVLAPDYPGFGENHTDPYARGYASATRNGIVNHQLAISLLQSLPEVDPERIGVIGHSLGGHNALFVAAFDPRVRAVVTSCGFNSFFQYKGGDLAGWSHRGYMPRIAERHGCDPLRMPFDFTEVLAALAPRPVFINAPMDDDNFEISGVKDCLAAAGPIYELLQARPQLVAVHPHCGHDFPPDVRRQAYAWLDHVMR